MRCGVIIWHFLCIEILFHLILKIYMKSSFKLMRLCSSLSHIDCSRSAAAAAISCMSFPNCYTYADDAELHIYIDNFIMYTTTRYKPKCARRHETGVTCVCMCCAYTLNKFEMFILHYVFLSACRATHSSFIIFRLITR